MKMFNEFMIAVLVIGFAVIIAQNQIIINSLDDESPIDKLMALPEMQEFKDYQHNIEYLTLNQVQQLAEQYPEIYGNITTGVYRAELVGEKNIIVLYDFEVNRIIRMFEVVSAEVGQ